MNEGWIVFEWKRRRRGKKVVGDVVRIEEGKKKKCSGAGSRDSVRPKERMCTGEREWEEKE